MEIGLSRQFSKPLGMVIFSLSQKKGWNLIEFGSSFTLFYMISRELQALGSNICSFFVDEL